MKQFCVLQCVWITSNTTVSCLLLCFFLFYLFVTHIISNEHNRACKSSAKVTCFSFSFKTKIQLIFSFVLTNTFTRFTLSFILFDLLLFDVFFCFSCEIPSAQDVTATVAATLLLLMLWFTRNAVMLLLLLLLFLFSKCIREFCESETLSWDCTIPYMNMCYSVYFSIVHTC